MKTLLSGGPQERKNENFCIPRKVIITLRFYILHHFTKKIFFVKYRSRVYLKKIFDPSVNELEKKVKKK
jgi:hypothetical protein